MYQLHTASAGLDWTFWGPVGGMVALILMGVPIWVVLGLGTTVLLSTTEVLPLTLVGETLFAGIDSFSLIAVPLFILTGDVIVTTGLSHKLLRLALATLGWLRSGLGTSTVLGCGFFACISGSDAADAAALGRITTPHLVKKGYPLSYAGALVASGATTGILIPPSISYIIIGLTLGISASTLFLAAAIPGLLVLGTIIVTNVVVNRVKGYETSSGRFDGAEFGKAFWAARYALLIPFIILGGIYSGIFTPTESASVAVIVAIVVGFGPTGRTVTRLLQENRIAPTVIELNIDTVRTLRQEGISAVYGDAREPDALVIAGVRRASTLIISGSDTGAAEVIRAARELNPSIHTFARGAYLRDVAQLLGAGAEQVFSGEGEVALAMTEAVLRRLGATPDQIDRERRRLHEELFGRGEVTERLKS